MSSDIINAILLFSLSIPVVMKYGILPTADTPYWLFGILFLILLLNVGVSSMPDIFRFIPLSAEKLKNAALVVVVGIALIGVSVTSMVARSRTAPVYGVHDIILQQEAAMRYIITGKNPYKETYFGTPMEAFNYDEPGNPNAVNPALYHFVMPPWYVMFPFAFYYSVRPVVGFFDGRMALLFTMGMLLVALWHWFHDKATARMAIILTAFSPAVIDYFIEGRSDIFAFSWLMVSLVLLGRKRFVWSSVCMMLAVLSKQTIWFIVPFYTWFLWMETRKRTNVLVPSVIAAITVGAIITLPFLLWDPKAFLDSVILYLNGTSIHSYPVSGYGLGMVLRSAGVITDIHAYYPFIIWQGAICIPLFILLFRWMSRKRTQSALLFSYAIFLMVFWYLSRYFNNSHLGYLSMVFVLAGLKSIDEAQV